MHPSRLTPAITTLLVLASCARAPASRQAGADESRATAVPRAAPVLTPQRSGTTALLQAVSVVDENVVWVSGHRGTWARTRDGGATWETGRVPGADSLQFRDVHAGSADTAWLMSAGTGALSRIYRTDDGGRTWRQQHVASDSAAFYDCMALDDTYTGVLFGDAIDGEMQLVGTLDGESWGRIPSGQLPPALPGEGSFAASGLCLVLVPPRHAWVGMGNTTVSRVLMTRDRGASWQVAATPIVAGEANGIAAVAFRDTLHGVVLGGTIGAPDQFSDNVARTSDGGRTWELGTRPPFAGAIYGGVYVPGAGGTLVIVSPKGIAWSVDEARTWTMLDTLSYWSVGFASPRAGWAVGPQGRIVRVSFVR